MKESHEITCINCPIGCRVIVETENGEAVSVSGNQCKRGDVYARQECVRPMRTLTAVIPCEGSGTPLSVRTTEPIPRDRIGECMDLLSRVKVKAPVRMGDVILSHVLGTDADVIATRNLKEETEMSGKLAPIRMHPAYRHGKDTPWGGDRLKKVFGKDIPDDRTGESLEVSAIPSLNSTDDGGRPLGELIARYGERLTGNKVSGDFPLLLKLLDARDRLSVQVHPDDDYAARVENKFGKTEAWVILDCDEGAELVYGVLPGTTREQLKEASLGGDAVEALLGRVKVHPGEVYYIPAGTVHAIGAGCLIYEIQQSSDVTYRFYDWNRTDAQGRRRELHIDKAIDVVDLSIRQESAAPRPIGEGRELLLKEKYFTLERWTNARAALPAEPGYFRLLTALEKTRIEWDGGSLDLDRGTTALLPADGFDLMIDAGKLLLAYPTV